MKKKLISIWPLIIIPSLMLIGFISISMISSNYHRAHYKSYIYLAEDIGAAKSGDTLSIRRVYEDNSDTTFIGFREDYPNGNKAVLLKN